MIGKIWGRSARAFLLAAALLAAPAFAVADDEPNFNGHYELVDAKAGRSFSLDVAQDRTRATVAFSAAMADGSGAAPDATGKGHVDDGVLTFKFTDSFKNQGSCTLTLNGEIYHLEITVLKVVDPSPFHFYGTTLLKKISDKPDNISSKPPDDQRLPQRM